MAEFAIKNKWCVYAHITPSNKVYIGITSQDPLKRWKGGIGYSKQVYFYRAILKYGWNNIEHKILVSEISYTEAINLEKYYINIYKSNNLNFGYNLTEGGEGTLGFHHSEKTKEKISAKHIGRKIPKEVVEKIVSKNKGKKRTDEFRKKISEIKSKQSEYTKKKISTSKTGISHSKEHCANISKALKGRKNIWNNKAVLQYSKDGEFIKEWENVSLVTKSLNIHQSNIIACCKGKLKSAGGFIWKYKL